MYEGEFEIKGNFATGWARGMPPAEPVWVELLAEGVSAGIARADLETPHGCGFILEVPIPLLQEDTTLQMRVVNSGCLLAQKQTPPEAQAARSLCGEVQVGGALTFSGWALDPKEPEKKLTVSAHCNGEKLAEAVACLPQYDPPEADGHAFILHLPPELANGEKRTISFLDSENRELPGSPLKIGAAIPDVSSWCAQRKNIGPDDQKLLAELLRKVERMLPDLVASANLADWKKAFPPPAPKGRAKFAIHAPFLTARELAALLKQQKGLDCRIDAANPDAVLLLRPEDRLHPHALALLHETLFATGAAIAYADGEDDALPLLRPAWDRHAFLGHDYLGPMLVRGQAFRQAGTKADPDYHALRFDLAMNCGGGIAHLPQLLSVEAPFTDTGRRKQAMENWLADNAPAGSRVDSLGGGLFGIHYGLAKKPAVSVIIPTRDHADLLSRCVQSLALTDWPDAEYIIVDNGSVEEDARSLLGELAGRENFRVIRDAGVFNYARLNNEAAAIARGELLCLLNNDTEILSADCLAELAAPLLFEGENAGCAGARLLWPNGLVQHGGVVTGPLHLAAHVGNRWLADEPGYMGRNFILQQYSAVTAACLLTPKKLFLETGGFDARSFAVTFNDVDYCLRLRALGKKIVWTPHAQLLHHESASRGRDVTSAAKARARREYQHFRTRWGDYVDPFHNPNLPLCANMEPFYGLALPPRHRGPRMISG